MNNDIISAVHSNHPQKITVFVECLFTQVEKKLWNAFFFLPLPSLNIAYSNE